MKKRMLYKGSKRRVLSSPQSLPPRGLCRKQEIRIRKGVVRVNEEENSVVEKNVKRRVPRRRLALGRCYHRPTKNVLLRRVSRLGDSAEADKMSEGRRRLGK